jgi:UDP-N-acetylglucosamine--N-acetylmuramyl-(pentapeptide) pyrophosphoryl-undecaprenol N-acetylglucosamine transferase
VGERLLERGASVRLLVSPKEVDQRVLRCEQRFRIVTVPAIGFSIRRGVRFLIQGWRSFRLAREEFRSAPPDVLLSMGGFTSAPPAMAARSVGADLVFHEANAIPGRANRWLAQFARRGYLYFPEAAVWFRRCDVQVLGMPVREQFQAVDVDACRGALGLAMDRPVLLVMGGSQGASGINQLMLRAATALAAEAPALQILHLAGTREEAQVREAYRAAGLAAVVRAFLTEMEFALGAADVAVGRAGASSIAELAAMRVPAILIPYPYAVDDHQVANARALERTGAAWCLTHEEATPQRLVDEVLCLLRDPATRERFKSGLAAWHRADADLALAEQLLGLAARRRGEATPACTSNRSAERATAA